MTVLAFEHFKRAIDDVVVNGDNDVIPFDVDTKFIADQAAHLAQALFEFGQELERKAEKDCRSTLDALDVFSERLLAPAGTAGFRITTKIHPFWNLYLNSVAVALAERHEPDRSRYAHSYRFTSLGSSLFDRNASWRNFKEASISDCDQDSATQVVIQTDISSFYEHVSHHRLENYVRDLLPEGANHATQVDVLLRKLSVGRSFGLPVGGQASRVLSEILLSAIDRTLTAAGLKWRRYVDDFVLIADSQHDSYRALGVLSHALADFGLSLNRTKTNILSSKHYKDYVETQLGLTVDDEAQRLKEIDLHFDPYSDTAITDYEDLKQTVKQLDIARLITAELDKGQPDTFVVRQASRALTFMEPYNALGLCASLLEQRNIHAFRASWSTIMRGIGHVRDDERLSDIHEQLDHLLDLVPLYSPHLMSVDTNTLHYLRTIRFRKTNKRAEFVMALFKSSRSATVRRACIDCWRLWRDRDRFISLRNEWTSLNPEEQRMVWLAAPYFGDDGTKFQKQVHRTLDRLWGLGLQKRGGDPFVDLYLKWVADVTSA